jgi:hypothetical protein
MPPGATIPVPLALVTTVLGLWFAGPVNPAKSLGAVWADYRARRARRAYYGDYPTCGHDWREHMPGEACGECAYEIEHEEPEAPSTPCAAHAPGYTF